MTDRYIDGTYDWTPNGRGGSYALPARYNNGSNQSSFKVRMNSSPFLPQSSSSNNAGVLRNNHEGNKAWRKPVVLYAGRIPENGELELNVNIDNYTEICVGHAYDDFIEVNPWYSLLPLRRRDQIEMPTIDYVDGSDTTATAALSSVKSAHNGNDGNGYYTGNDGVNARIAVVAPGVAMIERNAPTLNPNAEGTGPVPDDMLWDTEQPDSSYIISFRGELATRFRSYTDNSGNSVPHRIWWRKTGDDLGQGFGIKTVRYIVVR